ncbi:MAG: DUF4358 domain-containing protein [Ruminococcus sp.]|nr:DUF4358 domain-containing protein [Ruminococcus sp.]
MKKIIMVTTAVCLLAATFTACAGNKNNPEETTTPTGTTMAETTTIADETTGDETTTEAEGNGESATTLAELGAVMESVGEWPAMDEFLDKEMVADFMLLDVDNPNYKDIYIKKAMMSAAFGEYIIIEAEDVDAAVEDLEARRTKLIEVDAFYPEHQELAEQAVVGKIGNYAYLIAKDNAAEVEAALRNAIGE